MKKTALMVWWLVLGFIVNISIADVVTVFGPTQYVRTQSHGPADVFIDTFSATSGEGVLTVHNGEADGTNRVSSAEITINGEEIFGPESFSQGVYTLEAPVMLSENNSITVKLKKGKQGSYLTVELTRGTGMPAVTLTANPETIQVGESSSLSWSSVNADTCVIEPDIGSVDVNGSKDVSPSQTTTYTITASGPGGSATDQTVVTVTGGDPKPDDPFAAQYWDLIPSDATADYDMNRFSIITGLVQDLNGSPVTDALVTVHGHVEYGTASADAEGRFSIPVNGGGMVTLVYQKQGLITAHRKVDVSWNEISVAETVQMITLDPVSTTVTFDGNPETVVTHYSTEVTDEFGTRSSTTVFTGDNLAYEVDADGNVIGQLTTVTTRSTEFTTPKSMPAILPVNSGYTYCAELSVDGVQRVKFDKPVITWVDSLILT